ncbi:2Fe-2S iron-sulfur cluster-binding protein [Nocardia rhamnosiphila]|uniref:2Fe-2S iron-sulfur cluster-binding protein n=1 Tax=Nocardia rhamnosiphila TaxID=426716 RepID=A0ABV2WYN9_9NOCA
MDEGETVFHSAVSQGYRWPTVCQGLGSCRTCYMHILEGAENFDAPDEWEQEGLEDLADRSVEGGYELRLACQAAVRGDAVVQKSGVKRLRFAPAPTPDRDGPDHDRDRADHSHVDRRNS